MTCFQRGQKVVWISPVSGKKGKAFFVEHDQDFPRRDCILLIGIGPPGHKMKHYFRWPLRYTKRVA